MTDNKNNINETADAVRARVHDSIRDRGYDEYLLDKPNPYKKNSRYGKLWQEGASMAESVYPKGTVDFKRAQLEVLATKRVVK